MVPEFCFGKPKHYILVMNREVWCAAFHGVTKRRTWLSDWTELTEAWLLNLDLLPPARHFIYVFNSRIAKHLLEEISPAYDCLFTSSQGELMVSFSGTKLSSRTVLSTFNKSITLKTWAQFKVLWLQINSVCQLKQNYAHR